MAISLCADGSGPVRILDSTGSVRGFFSSRVLGDMVPTPEDVRLRQRGLCLIVFQRQEAFVQTVAEHLQVESACRENKCVGCKQTVCTNPRKWDYNSEFLTHGVCEFCCRTVFTLSNANWTPFTDEGLRVIRLYVSMKRRMQANPNDREPLETTLETENLILATLDDSSPLPVYLRTDEA